MDLVQRNCKQYVIVYSFIIAVIFFVHLVLLPTSMKCMNTIKIFYLVKVYAIVMIELLVFVTRGILAFVGALGNYFWVVIASIPLTVLAIVYEAVLIKVYYTGENHGGFREKDPVAAYRDEIDTNLFTDMERKWKCCGLSGPYDFTTRSDYVLSFCCEKADLSDKSCTKEEAYQTGCILTSYLIYMAGIIVIILLILDVLALITEAFVAWDIKNQDEDED